MSQQPDNQSHDNKQDYQRDLAARRKRAVRTALLLAAVAIAVFVGFIWMTAARS